MNQKLLILTFLLISFLTYAQETYKVGKTEYYYGKYYSTTGKPLVKRSEANKKEFLKAMGYDKIPYGYEIDHIIPLSEGGTDDPSNMQLLTIEQHKRKTAKERARRSKLNNPYNNQQNYHHSANDNVYRSSVSSKSTYSSPKNHRHTIYTGPRGGKYYYNSSGKKVYIKSKKRKTRNNYSNPANTRLRYSVPNSSNGRVIYTGPRGGRYYINSNGKKTYIK